MTKQKRKITIKEKVKSLHAMESYRWSRGISPLILKLDARLR
jgi:hypothetical protein